MRPVIDPLSRTAAVCYRRRVIGVLLSGMPYDGTAGLLAVKMHGGTTVVQDPVEAAYPESGGTAVQCVEVEHVLTLAEIAALLLRLTRQPVWRKVAEGQPQTRPTRRDRDKR